MSAAEPGGGAAAQGAARGAAPGAARGARSYRVEVMHGVNLDMLQRRDPGHYGGLGLLELERRIEGFAHDLGMRPRFFHSNFEGEMVERLHRLRGETDGLLINAGAWTHYSWAIRDALEIAQVPAVEVHLSDVQAREPWRRVSVFDGLCVAKVSGKGPDGYRIALDELRRTLDGEGSGEGRGTPEGGRTWDGERASEGERGEDRKQ